MQPIHLFILKKAKPVSSDLKLISPRNKYMIPVVKLGLLNEFFQDSHPRLECCYSHGGKFKLKLQ